MDWVLKGNFEFRKTPKRKYVYRRRKNGSRQMINIPKNVNTKTAAKNWLKKHYKTPMRRVPIFTTTANIAIGNRIKTPSMRSTPTIKFNCRIGNKLYHRVAVNGTVGFRRLNTNNKSDSLDLVPLRKTIIRKGVVKLDAGKQGVVFLASTSKSVPQGSEFVIKVCPTDKNISKNSQISRIEYKVQKALYNVVPLNIPRSIAPLIECRNFLSASNLRSKSAVINDDKDYSLQTLMFSEYIPYGPLTEYLDKLAQSRRRRINDSLMKSFIFQTLTTIRKIRRVYPDFRHNDLHLDNILVKPGKPFPVIVLNDFGFSTLGKSTRNPLVNKGNFQKNWGIGLKTGPQYDVHMFLNELRKWCELNKQKASDKFRNTLLFLNHKVPSGYRESNDRYTSHSRLKYGMRYPGLPTLDSILSSKWFSTSRNSRNLTPTATPSSKLKLNLNKKSFSNRNLRVVGGNSTTPRKNTPAPITNSNRKRNLTGVRRR